MKKTTFIADMQKTVVEEFLRAKRDFATAIYPRPFGLSSKYVLEHSEDFVPVKITLEYHLGGSSHVCKPKKRKKKKNVK